MSETKDPELDERLRELPRSAPPPPELEERVIRRLRERGLIAPVRAHGGHRSTPWRWAAAAGLAGLLVGVVGGLFAGRSVGARPHRAPAEEADRFLLLLTEPRPLETDKPVDELVGEYRAWAEDLARAGHLVAAERLEPIASSSRGATGALHEVTGFFVLAADGWEEARQLADTCPHLRYGGEITLRRAARTASRGS